jgi:hypothetical protein
MIKLFLIILFYRKMYICSVLSSEAGGPTSSGPLAFCHPHHPIVMPLIEVFYYFTISFTYVYFATFFSEGGGGVMISTVSVRIFVFVYKCNNKCMYVWK